MDINNRRYTGSKYKLMSWIRDNLKKHCKECNSFFDVFAGTGVVTAECLDLYDTFYINDFLYSNNIVYNAFLGLEEYSEKKIIDASEIFNRLIAQDVPDNYVSDNYGDKYFSYNDAKLIGQIRQCIYDGYEDKSINKREHDILLASLLYSFDKISNTVGHYEAYIKGHKVPDRFEYKLIKPIKHTKKVFIYREDSNELCRIIKADIAFVDPPYNSRQYSRFYHVLETIVKWDQPELIGVARKPQEENMSEYCRNAAPVVFKDLVDHLNSKYIVVTYNNTYDSKSTSSRNKISLEEITEILNARGKTTILDHDYNAFNAGKTDLKGHKEYLFICEVKNETHIN